MSDTTKSEPDDSELNYVADRFHDWHWSLLTIGLAVALLSLLILGSSRH